jgi:hypothetical protein
MTKVVYNSCYGGFSLSREAILRAREISGDPKWGGSKIKGDEWSPGKPVDRDYGFIDGIQRHDPVLVQVVEELGSKASGGLSNLKIEDISGTVYRIDEYDGNESVETPPDMEWTYVD